MTGSPSIPNRTLVLSDTLVPTTISRWLDGDMRVVTPNRQAARSLGVPSVSLDRVALRRLADHGIHPASRLLERRALRSAVARWAGTSDVQGFAATAEATLRELMRPGRAIERLADDASPRVRRLAAIASELRDILRADERIGRADLFWRAVELCREKPSLRDALAVVGYPRLPVAERAFIDACAAPGSVVVLPCSQAAVFAENHAAVEEFRAWGWTVAWDDSDGGAVGAELARRFLGRQHGLESAAALAPLAAPRAGDVDTAGAAAPVAAPRAGDLDTAAALAPVAAPPAEGRERAAVPGAAALAYADRDAEVRGTLASIKRLLLSGVAADTIAVVARHEHEYGPALLAVANEYGVPFRVLYDVPLRQTRVGAWVEALLEIAADDSYPFEETARWLRDPLTGVLDRHLWPQARRTRPRTVEAWRDLGVELPATDWGARATRAEHLDVLRHLFERCSLDRACARWAREAAALMNLRNGLDELGDPEVELSFDAFRAEVTELLTLLTTPATPGAGGVELHTPLSMFGASVEHLFVVGAAEGSLPDPVRPDPLLDPFERARLRERLPWLEDVRVQARREEISFWAMVQSARTTLTFSFPTLAGRSESLPSPYLERLGLVPENAPAGAVASLPEYRRARLGAAPDPLEDEVLPHARHAWHVELRRESEQPWDAYDGVTGIPYRVPPRGVGVTRLVEMTGCPFRFWARSVLRVREVEEAPTELDPALRGTLYHDVLHRALARAEGAPDLRAAALEHLEAAFAEAERALAEDRGVDLASFPKWSLHRRDHLTVLRKAVRAPDFLRKGEEVVALEADFDGTWQGIRVHGRVDRIDVGAERVTLVDYKSGGSVSGLAKDATGRASLDVQLPVYRSASDRLMRERAPAAADRERATRYYSITRAGPIPVTEPATEEEEWISQGVTAAWAEGSFPVDPDRDYRSCTYCPYDAVCRKGPRLERKRDDA